MTVDSPRLYLAPMEGIGDRCFRRAMCSVGGFDEACTSFIRIPRNGHIKGLEKGYDSQETAPIPLAAQLMGQHAEALSLLAMKLEEKGAPRIDLNCGCPSNTVTGRGAGSSVLKDPKLLYELTHALSTAVKIPVSIKIRSGFTDTTLFEENVRAIEEGGAQFMTIHPRTKIEGYKPPANWSLIAKAKELVSIPVVGNGDILSAEDAKRMLRETGCDALMIGRGAVMNPWIFHEIKGTHPKKDLKVFLGTFLEEMEVNGFSEKLQINKLKQLVNFLFQANVNLADLRRDLLRVAPLNPREYLEKIYESYIQGFEQ